MNRKNVLKLLEVVSSSNHDGEILASAQRVRKILGENNQDLKTILSHELGVSSNTANNLQQTGPSQDALLNTLEAQKQEIDYYKSQYKHAKNLLFTIEKENQELRNLKDIMKDRTVTHKKTGISGFLKVGIFLTFIVLLIIIITMIPMMVM